MIAVHEADESKGGAPLAELQQERRAREREEEHVSKEGRPQKSAPPKDPNPQGVASTASPAN